jgi:hypothetical protein
MLTAHTFFGVHNTHSIFHLDKTGQADYISMCKISWRIGEMPGKTARVGLSPPPCLLPAFYSQLEDML